MRSTCTRTHTHTGISKSITEYVTISRLACIISATRLSIKGSSQASPPASQISLMVSLHRPNNRCCLESCCFQVSNMCMCRPASATCSREDTPDEAAAHRGLKYRETHPDQGNVDHFRITSSLFLKCIFLVIFNGQTGVLVHTSSFSVIGCISCISLFLAQEPESLLQLFEDVLLLPEAFFCLGGIPELYECSVEVVGGGIFLGRDPRTASSGMNLAAWRVSPLVYV